MTEAHRSPSYGSPRVDLAPVRAVVEPIVREHGAEIVALEWTTEGRGFLLRVSVDKAGSAEKKLQTEESAVDLEVCASISRAISRVFDESDPLPAVSKYSLEVGSPGVERALRGEADYERFTGKKAKVRLRSPLDGQKVLEGELSGVASGVLSLAVGDGTLSIPVSDITSGHLVFEMSKSPKNRPSTGKKNRK